MPAEIDRIIKKLEEQKEKEGTLPQLPEFYQKLLQIQTRVGQRIDMPNPSFTNDAVNKRLGRGKPLLRFDELVLDWALLRDTFKEVVTLFANYEELFGSVTSRDIASALKEEGYEIDKEKIILDEPIKRLGIYNIKVKFSPQVEAEFKLWVVKK